ncbi:MULTISPECIES: hypothetical protein [unclassified Lysobacter]|uniref:hypothetical protein n=1 Tax=unclassified Lysobacter TaxID=2635362 RepID=UPI001BE689D6|nr:MULTISPECIES: hypothetical protein [unclassified Lysobacter]MBT2745551.1 hypothetical protein [Lysobacter sp. ISL-42]MBT2753490.1 hypothetical protein [Lysobacter sp. ISL-50]MBT2777126.1 hypothetical protein [Lysobacter sp. ISL-54]MBT2780248.1 hypothetical protein [Lysobacter sp. ISL-52]
MDALTLLDSPYKIYVQFNYPEIKDLLKHFLTLISATLVFSVTFSEKIINYQAGNQLQRRTVFISWTLFAMSLVLCGLGIYLNYLTAEAALDVLANKVAEDVFFELRGWAYLAQDLGAVTYVIALAILIMSAVLKVRGQNSGPEERELSAKK